MDQLRARWNSWEPSGSVRKEMDQLGVIWISVDQLGAR